ncbi:hypothetical protein HGQ17_03805 [Nesterenkonia sp. MY13]|uniref:Uncharacterized protein n=1 Tax=Nesterenkonia sedimenti TaxID=1463632 RepID=A0A7X8YCZ9_9MICC|nr:hypothetical protein [Nesterenkonia sedimenti]NLS09143.1 hypothetical protein [Nesterenkonia sedimenti]
MPDITSGQQLPIGQISFDGQWRLDHQSLDTVQELDDDKALLTVIERALHDLADEIDAANGRENRATPLSVARLERRRALHNNHLRIGPSQQSHLAA